MSSESGHLPRSSRSASDDAVDRLLDELLSGGRVSAGDPLAEAARRVRALADEPLPPATRERQLARIRHALAPPVPRRRFAGLRRRVAVAATAVTAALTFTGGVTYAAAQQALPGDGLYGLKRATERFALALERDPAEDAQLRVRFAQRRLREAAASHELVDELVAEAIAQLEAAAARSDVAGSQSVEILGELLARGLPGPASEHAQSALARVCVDLALERGEAIPSSCTAEVESPPPAPPPGAPAAHPGQGPGRGEQPPAEPPPGDAPRAPGRGEQPPAEPPPRDPPRPPDQSRQPPPDHGGPAGDRKPPPQDSGREPRDPGKGPPARGGRASDDVGRPSDHPVPGRGPAGASSHRRPHAFDGDRTAHDVPGSPPPPSER